MKRGYSHTVSKEKDDGNVHPVLAPSTFPSQSGMEVCSTTSNAAAAAAAITSQRIGGQDNHDGAPSNREISHNNQETEAAAAKRAKIGAASSEDNGHHGDTTKEYQPISEVVREAKEVVDETAEEKTPDNNEMVDVTVATSGGTNNRRPAAVKTRSATTQRLTRSTQRESPTTPMEEQKLPATKNKGLAEKSGKKSPATEQMKSTINSDAIVNPDTDKKPRRGSGSATLVASQSNSMPLVEHRSTRAKSARTTAGTSPPEAKETAGDEAKPLLIDLQSIGDTLDQTTAPEPDEVVAKYIDLAALPKKVPDLPKLKPEEIRELEVALEFGPSQDSWREDWSGNLAYADKEISNPIVKGRGGGKTDFKQSLLLWATNGPKYLRLLQNLIRYVFHQKGTPPMARKIIAHANQSSVSEIESSIRRVSYDPLVLRQDGWTTAKSKEMIGATGGPYLIGDLILWQNNEAVVIAYVHDDDHLGDLWKAMYLDDMETFDLEAEELQSARQKWERKQPKQLPPPPSDISRKSVRAFTTTSNFQVPGMEYGIVLAASYNPNARQGVFWPARIMHVSEMEIVRGQSKRGSTRKGHVDVVFLAPYWNSRNPTASARGRVESFADSMSRHGKAIFTSGPLFEIETIEVSEDQIRPYTFSSGSLDIEQLRVSFRFSGLPKAAFLRFLDSHRLAIALKAFAETELDVTRSDSDVASAALFDAHPFAVQTARFPRAILHLPFDYILSQLPEPSIEQPTYSDDDQSNIEAVINLSGVLRAMRPPMCWGTDDSDHSSSRSTTAAAAANGVQDTQFRIPLIIQSNPGTQQVLKLDHFIQDLRSLHEVARLSVEGSPVGIMIHGVDTMLSRFWEEAGSYVGLTRVQRQQLACAYSKNWALTKGMGEEVLSSTLAALDSSGRLLISEWRRASERIYKFVTHHLSTRGFGNKVTIIVTDSRCNLHVTSSGCVERPVRLPVALKAAKQAGAGSNDNIQLVTAVDDRYLLFAENCVLPKTHSASYLRRMKNRSLAIGPTDTASLTEDSDGHGGEDTNGSRGTWTAAVAAVATAIYAVDRIVAGECVNAFCATRPPGHHAGRELHPMKAVSNGFCVLNTAASAALYATTPVSEGGPGLRRVCVIDFDVHHGNGTQDILCSTHDPRFLYISLHAGGAQINGYEDKDGEDQEFDTLGSKRQEGIYPGRCGDTSPHQGVVNVPLGARVTATGVGGAMVDIVRPAVDAFSPDLIILSAGFDAHKNDPLGLGGMSAEDFGTLTDVICKLALRICSGRVLSVLEGGYGIPCCNVQESTFLPPNLQEPVSNSITDQTGIKPAATHDLQPPQQATNHSANRSSRFVGSEAPLKILELGEDRPPGMNDQVHAHLQKRLEKCHAEGFLDCVRNHVQSLANCNARSE